MEGGRGTHQAQGACTQKTQIMQRDNLAEDDSFGVRRERRARSDQVREVQVLECERILYSRRIFLDELLLDGVQKHGESLCREARGRSGTDARIEGPPHWSEKTRRRAARECIVTRHAKAGIWDSWVRGARRHRSITGLRGLG